MSQKVGPPTKTSARGLRPRDIVRKENTTYTVLGVWHRERTIRINFRCANLKNGLRMRTELRPDLPVMVIVRGLP